MKHTVFAALILSALCITSTLRAAEEKPTYIQFKTDASQVDPFLQEYGTFLQKCGFFYLATSVDNHPAVRPIGFTAFFDNQLPIPTSNKKEMYAQMLKNPEVDISTTAPDRSAFARFRGQATLCTDPETINRFLEAFPKFKGMHKDSFALFLIKPDRAAIFPMGKGELKTKTFTDKK
ncbi:MAG: pyridoxamine 5'-phosphate oxidase family protein [Kiritimatiellae bacterium]|nr:pyridoxamine 5'-phosphate oxidase family protein [Kiritimatiellia bacterium]